MCQEEEEKEEEEAAAVRSVLLAVRMPAAAGYSGIDPDLLLLLARGWLHPDRASDTPRGTSGAHTGPCHTAP